MEKNKNMVLSELGFRGDLAWVFNEEGSGARCYHSSVYYPDDKKNPQSTSGVTIDPGLDLGSGNRQAIYDTINFYASEGLLSVYQVNILREAIGLKKYEAISWINNHLVTFKNDFLVPETTALYVMDKYTAPKYWTALSDMPGIMHIPEPLISAVHTALLSQSYNRGPLATKVLVSNYVLRANWPGLAEAIKNFGRSTKSSLDDDRRDREAKLIMDALEQGKNFRMEFADINPRPLTAIPYKHKEDLKKLFLSQMEFREEIKPQVDL